MKNWNQHAMEHHPENFVRIMALVPQKNKECIQTETTNKTMVERLKNKRPKNRILNGPQKTRRKRGSVPATKSQQTVQRKGRPINQ